MSVQDVATHLLNRWERDIRIAACRDSVEFGKLQEQCGKLLQYQDDLFFGPPKLFLYAEDTGKVPRKISAELPEPVQKRDSLLLYAVLDGDEEQAVQHLHTILKSFWSGGRDACRQNAYSLCVYLWEHLRKNNRTISSALQEEQTAHLLHSQTYVELEGIFTEYVRNCCRIYKEGAGRQLVDWVMRYIADYYAGTCSAEEIAEGINLSPNYVRKRFKEATGQTILEYLTEVRLNKAAELLKTSTMKVKEVSVSVGYENIPYFTHLFSKRFGVTPNEYKKPSEH